MVSMTWKEVWARRLARHSLADRASAEKVVDVVSAVCGIHAQVMSAAELSIGIRVAGVTRRDVQAVIWDQHLLVKTFGIRGTVHLLPASELPVWLGAFRARADMDSRRYEPFGGDRKPVDAITGAMRDALDGQRLTLKQLGEEVVRRVGLWAGETTGQAWVGGWPLWRQALGEAGIEGVLCYGPPQGNEVTFVRLDQWAGRWADVEPAAALQEVFRCYLRGYGPATTRDFSQWFSIPPTAARDVATVIRDELQEVDVEGHRCYLLANDTETADVPEQMPVRLLPHFDCYVIGCHPRERLLTPAWRERVPPRTTPSQLPELLVDGMVAGIWERQTKSRKVDIRVEPLVELGAGQRRSLEVEAGRIGEIMEAETTLEIGEVAVRPHL